VYLSGYVSTGLMKWTAEDLAQHSRGVTKVVNAVTK
jgi:osmotically-inducible protein OsmY